MLQSLKILLRDKKFKNKNIVVMKNTTISLDTKVGDYTYIGFNCFITRSIIGRFCSIANNVSIGMGEHLIDEISTSSLFYQNAYKILTAKDCIIGNDVWIGVNSVIKRGVTIGDGAIIGANSFVNKDVEPYSIFGGVPAKLLKDRFSEKKKNMISKSKWWEHDLGAAKILINKLNIDTNIK